MINWHDYFTYDAETGNLIRKELPLSSFSNFRLWKAWSARFANKVAGGPRHLGYVYVCVLGKNRQAHRIIYEMHHGSIPEGLHIDHIDGNPSNNRIENLRLATVSQNLCNQNRKKNATGLKGVYRNGNGYGACITVDGKDKWLGTFPTKGLAGLAYAKASIRYHGVFSSPILGRQQARIIIAITQTPPHP